MKNLLFSFAATCAVLCASAQAPATTAEAAKKPAPVKKSAKAMTAAERQASFLSHTGGRISKPNSAKGRIVFFNSQTLAPESEIRAVFPQLAKDAPYNCVIEKGEYRPGSIKFFSDIKKELKADILVASINDADLPLLLSAPEEGWAVVNTAKLDAGLKGDAKAKFMMSRYRKELMRAYAHAVGTPGTQFPHNIISATNAHDVDLCEEFLPIDTMQNAMKRLKDIGVMPERMTTYRRACTEGWAPSPTNDVQKKIWDEVHALPDKPLQIKYDPKRDK